MSDYAPILDFDDDRSAIIEPTSWFPRLDDLPSCGVITWMADAYERMLDQHEWRVRHQVAIETAAHDIVEVELESGRVVVALSHVGAPVAALLYEAMVALGCTTTIGVGSSGGLVPEHPPGSIVVPSAAIRDEGVSYHYAPPARLAPLDSNLQAALRAGYAAADLPVADGLVWTTDALFRETSDTVTARVGEGAVAVDMEMSALATIAAFRGVRHGHAVYMADTLYGDEWEPNALIQRDTDYRYRLLLGAATVATAQV